VNAQSAKRRPWLEASVIPLASALMRVAWIAPALHFTLQSTVVTPRDVRFPAWLILALLVGSSTVGRLVRREPGPPRSHRRPLLGTAAGLLAVAGVIAYTFRLDVHRLSGWWAGLVAWPASLTDGVPALFVVTAAAAGIWWRGLTARWHDYGELFGGFLAGLAALGLLMLVASPAEWAARGLNVWVTMASFVLAGLLSLALLAAYEMLSWERFRGIGPGLSSHWLAVLGVLIVTVLVVGWGAGRLITSESAARAARALQPVKDAAVRGVEWVLLASGYLAFEVFGGLMATVQRVLERLLGGLVAFLRLWFRESAAAVGEAAARAGLGDRGVRIAAWALFAIVIAALFYVAIKRFRPAYVEGSLDKREFVLSRALLVAQIRGLIRGLRRPRAAPTPLVPLQEAEDARRAIRRLYRRMLTRMQDEGYARAPSLTPRAYEQAIAGQFDVGRGALHTLTAAYLVARYSPDTPTPEQVHEADQALRLLEAELGGQVADVS